MRIRSAGMLIVTSLLVLSLHFSPLIVKAAEDELEGIEGAEQQFEDIHSKESTEEDITEPHLESTDQTEEKVESEVDESEEVQIGEETETTSNATEEEVVESDVEMSTFSVASDSHQPGDRNEQVLEMKLDLMKLGFGTHWSNPTNYFGPDTERVVREFQAYYGLTVNGRGDEATLAKIAEQLSSPFQEGKRSDQIQELKLDLMKLGFGTHWSNPTTLYGPDTANVVREFQRHYGLVVNGIIDEVTYKKIEEIKNQPLAPGLRRADVIDFKLDLMKLGFGTHWSNPTNYFGPDTERVVREFQAYYGLTVNGRGDEATLAKIAEQLSSPFQEGKRSDQIQELKLDLMKLGFGTHWSNPTTLYGPDTVKVVRQFQGYYGLVVNGIVDEVTEKKIYEILASPYQEGKRSDQIQQLKFDLMQLGFGTHWSNPTTLYGPDTANVVRQFQRYYGLVVNGVMDEVTLKKMEEILTSPLRRGVTSEQVRKLKEDLMRLGYGLHWNNPTAFYGAETEEEVRKFQRDYNLPVSGIADAKTLEEIKKAVDRRVVKIFLDPGHGGSDSGAVSNGLKESDVVLDIARRTADVLRTQYSGVEVQLSRTGDTTVNLQDRANMANNWGADYFVSFHANAGGGRGFETYIHNGSVSNETRVRQRDIHNYLISRIGIHDRGMKSANFAVLRETKMPAILIEYMFIDNATERSLLSDPSYRRWLGQITAEAIASSYNLKKK